jgi:hypothetical protein
MLGEVDTGIDPFCNKFDGHIVGRIQPIVIGALGKAIILSRVVLGQGPNMVRKNTLFLLEIWVRLKQALREPVF